MDKVVKGNAAEEFVSLDNPGSTQVDRILGSDPSFKEVGVFQGSSSVTLRKFVSPDDGVRPKRTKQVIRKEDNPMMLVLLEQT